MKKQVGSYLIYRKVRKIQETQRWKNTQLFTNYLALYLAQC